MKPIFSNKQIGLMLFTVMLGGYGVIETPKIVAEKVGTGGWFPMLIATCIGIVIMTMNVKVACAKGKDEYYEFSNKIANKFFTYIFIGIYVVHFTFLSAVVIRMTSEIVKLNILDKTPTWALEVLLITTIFYSLMKGMKSMVRICEIYGIILFFSTVIIHLLIATQGNILNIQPFFSKSNLPIYIKSIPYFVLIFIGGECIYLLPIDKKENKNILKFIIIETIVIGLIYIFITESCISVIGVNDMIHYKDALIATIRRVEIPYLEFLRRIDGIFINTWIMSVFCVVTMLMYGAIYYIDQYVKMFNDKRSSKNYKIEVIGITLTVYIISRIPKSISELERLFKICNYFGITALIIIPLILFLLIKVRKYEKKL